MIRKLIIAALLALNIGAVANMATASLPWPLCLPCPDDFQQR
ncbi:MAG: hypothetical protein R2729_12155 [Bryobacteraceae bacterium]